MAVQTVDDFLAILEQSKLVSPNGLQQIRKATVEVADAKAVAKFLVSRGILTRFQATQLLAGRHALQLGPYRLLDRIASSGTGAVYAAQAAETKQPVSLKVLPRKLLEDKETLTKLKQQVGKLKSLEHPAFCRAIELRREGEQVVLVLEPVEGESLAQRVQSGGPLPFDTAGRYVRQVADALTAAHQRDLVHGDLTPQNLICDAQDQLKLIDVGTATLNPAGVSADYAAPEVSAGQPPAPSSDVYSLGCTLYFLLTGKPPFPDGTAQEKRQKHASELPAGVLELRPDAPPELMKLCIRMMAKKPEQRPELEGAVVGAIDEYLAAAATPAAGEADDAGQDELTETSDHEMTDPDVDRALAEAMAASDFDEHLDEPASEAAPPAAAAATAANTAKGPADDVDDVLAEAMAASEFDHSIEDAEQTDQRKARLGDVSGGDDDLLDEIEDDYEVESPPPATSPETASAVATGGPKLLGLDLYRLLGVKADDEPAAKKKKLIIGGVASGVIAIGLVFAVVKFGLPMVMGDSGKSSRRGSNRAKQVAQRDNRPAKPETNPQPANEPKQPADTVVPPPGGGTPPGDTAPGEETPADGGTTTEPSEDGGDTATPPDGTGDESGETGDGTGTTPAEVPGTAPAEPPAETPAEEVNPLEGLATGMDLPREPGAGAVSLGPLKIAPETACTAELIGATETGIDAGAFTLKPTEIPQADRAWIVEMSAAGGAPVTIGGFMVKEGELTYQWSGENATSEPAQALRYLALKLQCGTNQHVVALHTPRLEKPIVTEFDRGSMTAFVDVDWRGDPQLLFAQITELEGKFPAYEFKAGKSTVHAGGDKTALMIGEGDPPMLAVMVDASLTDKLSLVLTPFFRLESEQKTLPFNASTVNLWGNKLMKTLADEKESLGTAKKREAEARGTQAERLRDVIKQSETKIAEIDQSLALLKKLTEFAKATHNQGKIHFRVFYKLGDAEIDLVRTRE